ncbi:PEGA domain-containing protein [Candidatus Saccharibacteria bacterium]|nr:PEGA domain-containing protein [Candidatus Saccharibacteria bacterium]
MDPQTEKKRQAWKVILTDSFMTLVAVVLVVVLGLTVSGYWINENFEVARSGMLQISSEPTGATVIVDDAALPQRTNVSRVIPVGEHSVKIEKDGYDTWFKTVEIKDGLLYRLRYPRLFPNEPVIEKTPIEYDEATTMSVSPKRDYILVANKTNKWTLVNLEEEKINPKEIDLAAVFPSGINGKISNIEWNNDQNRILLSVQLNDKLDWFLFDLNNTSRSINLSDNFGIGFTEVDFLNGSADNLLTLRDKMLQKINVNNKSISAILAEGVEKYHYYGDEVVFTANGSEGAYIGLLKANKDEVKTLRNVEDATAEAFISKFYDNEYLTLIEKNKISVFKREDLNSAEYVFELSFTPTKVKIGRMGEYVVAISGNQIATLDMEAEKVREWQIETTVFDWLDDSMIYQSSNGEIVVYDFDGLNRRVIATDAREGFPVVVTNDDKWLYYMNSEGLVREALRK